MVLPFYPENVVFRSAACTGSAAACASVLKGEATVEFETVDEKIDFDRFRSFKEIFVDDVLETVDVKGFIRFSWLIQSHSKTGAASAAFV